MDKKLRDALVKKLSGEGGFDPTYSKENVAWFIGAILDQVAKMPTADPAIEGTARPIVQKANARVKADRNFTLSLVLDPKIAAIERKAISRRVETIYGVIAENMALADTSFDLLRQFLVKRRYRAVVRMVHHINPNSNGYIRYPKECPKLKSMALNSAALPHWVSASGGVSIVPMMVKAGADPKNAAELILSKPFTSACDGNLLDCGNGTGCTLMDTLFEAADSGKLLKAVHSRGPRHLLVINPTLRLGPAGKLGTDPHFLFEKDSEPKKLFSKQHMPEEEFQVGDCVFLMNHGLYPNLAPSGLWTGEHALVVQCGNRKPADPKGFLYSGHGLDKPTTIKALYDDLLPLLQSYLHRAFKIAQFFFKFRLKPTSIAAAKFEHRIIGLPPALGPGDFNAFLFKEATVNFTDFTKPASGGRRPTLVDGGPTNPLVIFDIPQKQVVLIAPATAANTIDNQIKTMDKMTFLELMVSPGTLSLYDTSLWRHWQLPFLDSDTGKRSHFPLFGTTGVFQNLEPADMPINRFGRRVATPGVAEITRPTSDTSSTYVTFLRSVGAIP